MSQLRAEKLKKRYKARTVVKDVSLDVSSGEVVGLLGPNGAGKTTCFYMMVGLVALDGGDLFLDKQALTHTPIHRRARLGLSYLPQEASIFRKLTVAENIRAVLELRDLEEEAILAQLDTLLHDPSVNVRLAAVDALRRFSSRDDVRQGTQRAAADVSSPLLQIAVIDYLVETHDRQAVGLLQRLSGDLSVDESVRGRAAWGLERLSS